MAALLPLLPFRIILKSKPAVLFRPCRIEPWNFVWRLLGTMGKAFHQSVRKNFHPCFLGIGFVFAWNVSITYSASPMFTDAVAVNTLILLVRAITYVCSAAAYKKAEPLLRNKGFICLCSGLGSVASLVYLLFFNLFGLFNVFVAIVCALVIGFTQSCLMLSWYDLFARMSFRELCVYYSAGNVVASVIPFHLSFVDPGYKLIIAVLPIVGSLLYGMSRKDSILSNMESGREHVELKWSFPFRPMALMVVTAFIMGCTRFFQVDASLNYSLLGHIVSAAFLLLAAALIPARFNLKLLYLFSLPLCIIGLFLSRQMEPFFGIFGAICTNAGLSFFFMFVIILFCSISYRYGINVIWLIGFAEAMKLIGMLLGNVTGLYLVQNEAIVSWRLAADVAAIVIVIAFTVFLSEKDYRGTWGSMPIDDESAKAPGFAGASNYEMLLDRCMKISRQYSLTRREEEVLFLLAQNKTVPTIEKELSISNATAKTHCHHIYAKLNVHKKKDLIALVQDQN